MSSSSGSTARRTPISTSSLNEEKSPSRLRPASITDLYFVCGNVAGVLRQFAIERKKGYVCTNDAGVIVEEDPDTVRGPDVTFCEDMQTADDMKRQYAEMPPRLAEEVVSPGDRVNRTIRRVTQMLQRGVEAVWVVDSEARDVSVYRSGKDSLLHTIEDFIPGGDVLSGFRCRVADFFQMPS